MSTHDPGGAAQRREKFFGRTVSRSGRCRPSHPALAGNKGRGTSFGNGKNFYWPAAASSRITITDELT